MLRSSIMKKTICFLGLIFLFLLAANSYADTIVASSCSRNDVASAVSSASDGDTILIPNGSCTWTSGITTTKQIFIRAKNYTPTPAGTEGSGATSRNVILTNNLSSGSHMFSFTSGNSFHCGVGGIQFNEASSSSGFIRFNGSGSKIPVIFDCYFHNVSVRQWPKEHAIDIQSMGALIWNTVMVGTALGEVGEGAFLIKHPRAWTTNSTMGMDDTNGNVNIYVEDSTFKNLGICPDIDDNGRFVARHCVYDGAWAETHGFTSLTGGRHWEFYDNVYQQTTPKRNLAGRYFWARAGTGVFTDNQVNAQVDPGYYGTNNLLNIGDNTSPKGYPQQRQPGWGYENGRHVSDPIYIWNQTGSRAYTWSVNSDWSSMLVQNRDIFVNNGAKPGYTKYTYPHPARKDVPLDTNTTNTTTSPNPPNNLRVVN